MATTEHTDAGRTPSAPGTGPDIDPGEEQEVTKLELFFDLVYVFAISQLSEHLVSHLTWRGALETLVLSMTVFVVWSFTTYESTMVLARKRTARWVVLAVMVASLLMNSSITHAFEDSPWTFVLPMLGIQLGRTSMTRVHDVYQQLRAHRVAMIVWQTVSAVPWVIGAAADEDVRLWWWTAALAVDLVGMWAHHPLPAGATRTVRDLTGLGFDVAHQLERCRLFLLICLGEGILTTGSAMVDGLHHPQAVVCGLASMLVIVGIWYVFFGVWPEEVDAHLLGTEASSTGRTPFQMGRIITNGQQVLVIGLVAFAVGTEVVVAEPGVAMGLPAVLALFGGIAVCVTAFWVFQALVTGRWWWPSLAGADAALLVVGCACLAAAAPGIVAMGALVLVVGALGAAYRRDVLVHL